jgi:hypothetical protein
MSTLEMFKLKGVAGLADRYLAKNEAGRRAMLGGEIAGLPNSTITPGLFKDGKPVLIDRLEWYFTPNDIVRIYDWIRHNSEGGAGAEARKILAINGALPPASATAWAYVGYKGGSEPGVINLSWLLQGKDGNWYVVTGSWNDPVNAVDLTKFFGLLSRAVDLTAPK